ncbi:MAG: Lrp/AsnC family transcriptional regulator [Rhodoferax sp.]
MRRATQDGARSLGRAAVALANKLHVARATVQNRIAKLENEGTIVRYTVRQRPDAQAHRIGVLNAIRAIRGISNTETSILLPGHRL